MAAYYSLISPKVFLIVCPLVFAAGVMDSIAGGGALISIPAYLIAGIPVHTAIATNKLSASFGAGTSAFRFVKNRMVNFRLGIPSVAFAMVGSTLGANLSMRTGEGLILKVLIVIFPILVFLILNKRILRDYPDRELTADLRTMAIVLTVAFLIGGYDGFFGPGAGTFTILGFNILGKMSLTRANAQTKLINFTTTVTALFVFLLHGQVMIPLGIAAGLCNMAGSWIGAGLAIKKGGTVTRPAMLVVMGLFFIKIVGVY